jgi:hypothetical protein
MCKMTQSRDEDLSRFELSFCPLNLAPDSAFPLQNSIIDCVRGVYAFPLFTLSYSS